MAEKVFMIALSPTMEEGTILKWLKSEGDEVQSGDLLCEVETDKASMEYESSQNGHLLKILRSEGARACIGDTIAVLGTKGEDISALLSEIQTEVDAASSKPSPASETLPSAPSPTVSPSTSIPPEKISGLQKKETGIKTPLGANSKTKVSPVARKIAEQRGIELAQVVGSGPSGRIIKRDIENFTAMPTQSIHPLSDTVIPVSGKRAVIARRLAESKFTAPHYYVKNKVNVESMVNARNILNKQVSEKVSFNAFILKYVGETLKRHPAVNASWQGDSIVQFASIDIGLAVDLGTGLITPIVRNVGNKGVRDIDAELKMLIAKVGEGTLRPEEYTGASFTVSNLGSFGVDEFTAIINPPGSAILALGKVNKVPVYADDGTIKPASLMSMTLSCDHRVIDGAVAGRFISDLQKIMENPVYLLF